jgi:hypothetical protein
VPNEGNPDDAINGVSAPHQITAVPEPATWALWLAGASGRAAAARRRACG